mgnify:CR=1 FL=1
MTEVVLKRGYLSVAGRQVHYRSAGHGPPVVMLHPSPLSSAAVLPMANALAEHFTVVALDTPGYGRSDPMPDRGETLRDYAVYLAATLDALGLQRVCLYGAATGAQLAVATRDSCVHLCDPSTGRRDNPRRPGAAGGFDRHAVSTAPECHAVKTRKR